MLFCVRCGAQMPEGTVFCTNCGASIEKKSMSAPEKGQEVQKSDTPVSAVMSMTSEDEKKEAKEIKETNGWQQSPSGFGNQNRNAGQPGGFGGYNGNAGQPGGFGGQCGNAGQPGGFGGYNGNAGQPGNFGGYNGNAGQPGGFGGQNRNMGPGAPYGQNTASQPNIPAPVTVAPAPNAGSAFAVVGTGGFIGWILLFSIPVVGLISAIIVACGGSSRVNLRNYAKAILFWKLLLLGLFILLVILGATVLRYELGWIIDALEEFEYIIDIF